MPGLHVEAQGVSRAGPEAVWELVGDASSYSGWGSWSASGYQRPGVYVGGPARTHAAERCANAAVRTVSCAPIRSDPKGSQMTTVSAGLAAMPCLELAAAWPAEVTAPGQLGCDGAPEPVSPRC